MSRTVTIDSDLEALFSEVLGAWREKRAPRGLAVELDRDLWATLEDLGLTRLTDAEGSGASWIEAAGLLRAAAAHGAPVPLAENDLLAGWLLERAGIPADTRIRTAALLDEQGHARRVPWASQVDAITVLYSTSDGWKVADVASAEVTITADRDLAGQPRDAITVELSRLEGRVVDDDTPQLLRLRGALARAAQSAGAMQRAVELSITHASERSQFGRPIAKFQAVQHLIATAAAEAALASAAVDAAVLSATESTGHEELELRVAIASSVVGHASSTVVRNVHQVHGAIGTTSEHALHEYTKPILGWRSDFGSVASWDARLTEMILAVDSTAWRFGLPATD